MSGTGRDLSVEPELSHSIAEERLNPANFPRHGAGVLRERLRALLHRPTARFDLDDALEGEGCPLISNGTTIVDEDSVDCAMQALRDGTPAEINWSHSGKMDDLTTRYHHMELHVQISIREAYVQTFAFSEDEYIPPVSPARHSIRDKEYFEMCSLMTDLSAKAGCVFQATDGETLEICSGS